VTRYVAFLRAINVGGRVVKMDHLRRLCESIPLANVSTFIASGNVIFESKKPAAQLELAIEKTLKAALGYEVATMVRTAEDLVRISDLVAARRLYSSEVRLYVGFLKHTPAAATVTAVAALSTDVDILSVHGSELYWQSRTSFAESTVTAAQMEKLHLGPMTVRNINTVRRLAQRTA
jgi:uncharacterized protein (DUF1697 family)